MSFFELPWLGGGDIWETGEAGVGTAARGTHPPLAPHPDSPGKALKAAALGSESHRGFVWHTAGHRAGTDRCDAGAARSLAKNG